LTYRLIRRDGRILLGLFSLLLSIVLAALLSTALTWILRPLLIRYALARPNARSSHRTPTPQGAGIAVLCATLVGAGIAITLVSAGGLRVPAAVFGAGLLIAIVGAVDDIKSIPVLPRLLLQTMAIAAVVFTLPNDLQIVPSCPLWIERCILLVAGLWFVNLVNFMDGLDWMTVAETVPVTAGLVLLGVFGDLTPTAALVAAALGGAMLGFAPFNRPVAKVFLGDVGSLPIGLLLGWCLLELAYRGQLVAALLLPLYYLADATVTMLRRLLAGEKVWVAHRSHFYQRATDNGFTVLGVVGTVFQLNIGLAALAIVSTQTTLPSAKMLLLAVGAAATTWLMLKFSKPQCSIR
jgi:UDP-N-acetylmuramyl pentapeptide phosphotransferase/UDP-N-acetylglucosamine-1-phosphate transferase